MPVVAHRLAFAAALFLAAPAVAAPATAAPSKPAPTPPPPPPRPVVRTAPDWLIKPSPETVAAYYPLSGAVDKVSGRAVIAARVCDGSETMTVLGVTGAQALLSRR